MEELLARAGGTIKTFEFGEIIDAKILSIDPRSVSLDIGGKSEGIIIGPNFDEVKSYIKTLKIGDTIKATVVDPEAPDGLVRLSLRQFATNAIWDKLKDAKANDEELEVIGKSASDKGIVVELDSLIGFIPASQLSKAARKDPNQLLQTPFKVKVAEVNRSRKRIVFSEKAVSEGEEIALLQKAQEKLTEGEVYQGTITQITNFGIFVEIPITINKKRLPVEGLVHISELSWKKIDDPATKFSVGDKVEVSVLGTRDDKLALSIKQAIKDPWSDIEQKYSPDQKIKGKVIRKSNFGVFVELEPGVEGLVHMTKIPPGTDIKKGQEVDCYIEEVNGPERRISLGLVLTAKPIGYK